MTLVILPPLMVAAAILAAAMVVLTGVALALVGPGWLAAPSLLGLDAGLILVAATDPPMAGPALLAAAVLTVATAARFGTAPPLTDPEEAH